MKKIEKMTKGALGKNKQERAGEISMPAEERTIESALGE